MNTMPAMMVYLLRLGFVIFCGLAGVGAWWLNGYLFEHYEVTEGVNLIYWPNELREQIPKQNPTFVRPIA
jgi:hypothetical protein